MTWTWRAFTRAEPELIRLEILAGQGGRDWIQWAAVAVMLDRLAARWATTDTPLRHPAVWRAAWRRLDLVFQTGGGLPTGLAFTPHERL
jgi:hypothetical protein